MLRPIIPMEPKSKEPNQIPASTEWLTQVKWDGVRILTYVDGKNVKLFNRKINERTLNYPELLETKTYLQASSVILDGEIIALGKDGKPSFHEVMKRDSIRNEEKVEKAKKSVPVTYMIFDVLYYNGEWINNQPLNERNRILWDIIKPQQHIQLVTSHDDGKSLFSTIKEYGMEGIVLKKKDSPYLIGEKKDYWLKIKNYQDVVAVVGGYTVNGPAANALLLGLYDQQGRLWYIGHAGTGRITQEEWRMLTQILQLNQIESSPFVNYTTIHPNSFWVNPQLTVKVKFAEWTPDKALRQPSIEAFVNIPPNECLF
ncbi:MAG: non-homologous end-joining DNA ligase [Bacillota bacterium]